MSAGVLEYQGTQATVDGGVWSSDDPGLAELLNALYPPPPYAEAGDPSCRMFRAAVEGLGATVVQEPQPEPWGPGSEGKGMGHKDVGSVRAHYKSLRMARKAEDTPPPSDPGVDPQPPLRQTIGLGQSPPAQRPVPPAVPQQRVEVNTAPPDRSRFPENRPDAGPGDLNDTQWERAAGPAPDDEFADDEIVEQTDGEFITDVQRILHDEWSDGSDPPWQERVEAARDHADEMSGTRRALLDQYLAEFDEDGIPVGDDEDLNEPDEQGFWDSVDGVLGGQWADTGRVEDRIDEARAMAEEAGMEDEMEQYLEDGGFFEALEAEQAEEQGEDEDDLPPDESEAERDWGPP